MTTRGRERDAEALQRRLNDPHAQSTANKANKEALEDQVREVKQSLQNPDFINQAENEKQPKALLDQINKITEKEEQHGSEMDVDHGLGSDPPDFAQTREDQVPVDDRKEDSIPTDYADIRPIDRNELTGDDEEGRDLDGGMTLAMNQASKGSIYLNAYGYKSCAITVWEYAQAECTVGSLTNIRGNPHKKALETNEDGDYIHKGKIGRILNVAWEPKRKIRSIDDILDSVEELNPENKRRDAKYRYPFSTVLVEWTDGLERTWISRTNYKTLSSQSKTSNERTDMKFYKVGVLQVKRYRDISEVGQCDDDLGDLERTPPGLTESPEPGESSVNRGVEVSHSANNMQRWEESGGLSQVDQFQGAQTQSSRTSPSDPSRPGQASQNPGSGNPGSQNHASQDQGDQNQTKQNPGSQSHENTPRTMITPDVPSKPPSPSQVQSVQSTPLQQTSERSTRARRPPERYVP
ncbi:uncharacterized protein LDX57_007812 [Aspergillus melleus]|uniref:uncharacterized protein n=1 Tax=Aspergillus melleus TaxID=138277 RepID=UPI001E8D4323|nr:uncharacterized protein LDX57_007812 [Aspergillus melleus]KAH8430142.1 hypothetical protein LDX57_007812 [Aspergillus melleus]